MEGQVGNFAKKQGLFSSASRAVVNGYCTPGKSQRAMSYDGLLRCNRRAAEGRYTIAAPPSPSNWIDREGRSNTYLYPSATSASLTQ